MEKFRLGGSELEVSALCLGTMYFGVKVEETLAERLLDIYYERGGRFLDTANKYATWVPGFSEPVGEKLLGRWLRSRGHRDVVVATKLGYPYQEVPQSLAGGIIRQEVEKSLKRLGVECIDLLYGHVDDYSTPQEEYMQTFSELVAEGKVRELGMSNVLAWRVARANMLAASRAWPQFSCVQTRLSLLWPRTDADFSRQVPATCELLDLARVEKLRLLCYSPLLQGCFGRSDRGLPEGYVTEYNLQTMALVGTLAAKYGISGNTLVTSWLLEQGFIPVITGSNTEQIIENCTAARGVLERADLAALDARFYPRWLPGRDGA